MANVGNSWSGHRDLSSQGHEDKKKLYTRARSKTTLEVQGAKETRTQAPGEYIEYKRVHRNRDAFQSAMIADDTRIESKEY